MNLLSGLFGHLSPAVAYTVVAGVVLAESVLLTAVFVPTLTLLLTAGALARTGQLSLPLVVASAAGAAIAGDFLAHRTGWHLGKRLRTARMARRIPAAAWQRAETLMTRHGGRAVFLARLLPMVRTLAPHFAGATRLPYRRIAPYSVTAACLWATLEAGIGYSAATSLQRILTVGGPALAVVVLTALATTLWWRRSRHSARRADASRHGHSGRRGRGPGALTTPAGSPTFGGGKTGRSRIGRSCGGAPWLRRRYTGEAGRGRGTQDCRT
ncbi:membrane protein DedA with SNARE-associated domain [Kitasatospora gansuensis]|uniref:Membrane protein DedA with SNARE-associated domain n=1 Tax=Kitasatospora gansuensis TaxID=258050 RepID=A0A7W7WG27_9ACTN|nr:VTT domain-containing protein [Kitasatospora gansuensis]MBB4945195.1 membrane protein DedA with SNARE-associated domain [Kitasatospora gansuensis]